MVYIIFNSLSTSHRDIRTADRWSVEETANPLWIATDGCNAFEQLVNIPGNHRIFNPADNFTPFYLETQQDITAEISTEHIALTCS